MEGRMDLSEESRLRINQGVCRIAAASIGGGMLVGLADGSEIVPLR